MVKNSSHRRTYPASKGMPKNKPKVKRGTPTLWHKENAKRVQGKKTPVQKKLMKKFHTRKSRKHPSIMDEVISFA